MHARSLTGEHRDHIGQLAAMMLELQDRGCHNINLVTPEHVVPQILEALSHAIEGGLRLPIVYNTSCYDSLDSLRLMDGIVDIYLPDLKVWTPGHARRYLMSAIRSVPDCGHGDEPPGRHAAFRRVWPGPPRAAGPPSGDARDAGANPGDLAFRGGELVVSTYVNLMAQ